MRNHFDTLIVGTGLIGSAAARALSAAAVDVLAIGAREPAVTAQHDGPFASHHDAGRLTRRLSGDPLWSALAIPAMAGYRALEAAAGIAFYEPIGCLYVAPPALTAAFNAAIAPLLARGDTPVTQYADGAAIGRAHAPLTVPFHQQGVLEGDPAGYIDPRALVRAQLTVAARQGATLRDDTVIGLTLDAAGVRVATATGATFHAKRALMTTGAYANSFGLLPQPLALRIKSETIVLARVSAETAASLRHLPALIYYVESPDLSDIYMLPPLRYPDGHYYLKLGANTRADRTLPDFAAIQTWMREGDGDPMHGALRAAVEALLPDVAFESFETRRCLVTYSPHGYPVIDALVPDRLFVATAGNGAGAKGSDTIGRLAADRVLGRWSFDWPSATFHAQAADASTMADNPMFADRTDASRLY